MISLRNQAAIVGIGHVPFGRRGELAEKGHLRLAVEAITLACEDAGITGKDVDGYSSYYTEVEPAELVSAFGAQRLRYTAQTWGGGGASMCGAFQNAALGVTTGQADYVVVHKVATMAGTARYGQAFGQMGQGVNAIGGPFAFSVPYGLQSPGQMFALAARRHMHLYGTTSEQFAHVAINARTMAANNPAARFREPITVADHQASPMIADPLRRLDFCMESDYGCAVVIASADRARDLRQKPAYIAAAAVGAPYRYGNALMSFYNQPDEDFASSGHRTVADELYRHSGLTLQDMHAAMLYDHFTAMMIMALEDFGFCKKGEGGPYVADGNLALGGPLPVNTHGGNLAEAYTHGMTHVMEAVRQIRGSAINQIPSATNILVVGGAGPSPTSGMILTGSR
ncbi:thiolase C-terminal domain-containing protein [Mycobacterium avium]|uniref:Lipid-transfer protein n=1 Tax=Mycobacterium avium (strain 104) TaxID=243243 RepID=A0A0H2ZYH8_MYCA1|nr:lipid-transfer protein [Mycobacterium avium]ABK67749.1 lipid-transfer protein [Mycobacterium avium 104]KDP08936.1 thiolase [Mycobacterium avium subsp. hominissuis 101]MCG3242820.1 lipid-transfer protein [Mycobacterium avium subsp. hominissuis]